MSVAHIVRSSPVVRTARVAQIEGMFDVPPSERSEQTWEVDLPLTENPWSIGLIVGPSGSGKSTVARELFGQNIVTGYEWPNDKAIVDGFPKGLSLKDISGLLSSVGFSSPPSWLRPFQVLSNGEQFRVTLARALAECSERLVVIDEFTSVVDRTVARIGSAAVAKSVRLAGGQFIAVTCHYDVEEWLDPDWVYEPHIGKFSWRSLQGRPKISLEIVRVDKAAWRLFRKHHYLDHNLHVGAKCFCGLWNGEPVVFSSVIKMPHPKAKNLYHEHRTVTLPDYQGVGIGNAMSALVASIYKAAGKRFTSVTSHPAMIRHRAKSPMWDMIRKPGRLTSQTLGKNAGSLTGKWDGAVNRYTASFAYVGPPAPKEYVALLA